jgi:hypothetical protein
MGNFPFLQLFCKRKLGDFYRILRIKNTLILKSYYFFRGKCQNHEWKNGKSNKDLGMFRYQIIHVREKYYYLCIHKQ